MSRYSHFASEMRKQIAILRAAGHGVHAIAKALGRHPATISRELERKPALNLAQDLHTTIR